MDIRGGIQIKVDSRPGAYHKDSEPVKQQWPPFTLWSKSAIDKFAHSGESRDVIEHGLSHYDWGISHYDWGMFLTMQTGDFPPEPPFDPQHWQTSEENYETGSGDTHSRFTAYETDKKKQISVFKRCEAAKRFLWFPL